MVGHDKAVAPMKCQAPPCDREAVTAGYCPKHYQQIRRCGRLTPEREYGKWKGAPCQVDGCERVVIARGYCERHYQQVRRHGRLIPEKERPAYGRKGCLVEGCPKVHSTRGYCKQHYMSEFYLPRRRKEATA